MIIATRILALASCLALAACGQTASTSTSSVTASPAVADEPFIGSRSDIIRLAIKAIQAKGWKLDQVNENVGIVSFETSMSMGSWSGVKANLIIEDAGRPNAFRVSGTARQNLQGRQLAAFDIGDEAQGVVREAIVTMKAIQASKG